MIKRVFIGNLYRRKCGGTQAYDNLKIIEQYDGAVWLDPNTDLRHHGGTPSVSVVEFLAQLYNDKVRKKIIRIALAVYDKEMHDYLEFLLDNGVLPRQTPYNTRK